MSERTALVGRERHIRELTMLIDGVGSSRGHHVVLSGEAGAGKTRLAEEAAAMATRAGVNVAWATCWGDSAAPLSTWLDLLAVVEPHTKRPAPAELAAPEADPDAARAVLIRSLVTHLRTAIGDRPTLLVVDDVQWCDPLSLHAIEALARSLRASSVGLLATFRDEGTQTFGPLEALIRAGRHIVVPPLTGDEVAQLAVQLTGRSLSPSAVTRLRERTAGNVLFTQELLANPDAEAIDHPADSGRFGSRAVAMFAGRVAALSPECRKLLQAAGVIGRRFRLDVLAETLSLDAASVFGIVDEAQVAGLVRGSGIGAYEFSHPLMAEACYAGAGLPRRVRLHREVAEALERLRERGLSIPSAELAHHYAAAAASGVAEKAVAYAAAAGRESMDQLAYEDAATNFERALAALDLCPADDTARAELLLDLGDAQAAAGRQPAARSTYELVVRLARQHGWSHFLARAALGIGSGPGGFEVPPFDHEQIALLEEAASLADGALRSQVLARLSVSLSLDADLGRRADLSTEAVTLARDAGDELALGYALASWCDVIAGPSDVERRLDASAEILACAANTGDTRLELLGRRLRVVSLLEAGAFDEVDGEIAAFATRADRLGQVGYSWYVPLWRAMRAAMKGDLEAAERLRLESARIGELANSDNADMLTISQRAMLHCETREAADAIAFFEDLTARWPGYAIMTRPALAYAHAAGGDLDRAADVLAAVTLADYTFDALGSEWLPSVVMLAHAAWLTRADTMAAELYAALAPFGHLYAIDGIGGYNMGSVERPLGLLATLSGDTARASRHLDAALLQHRRTGAVLLVAGTLRDSGEALGDEAQRAEAKALFASLGLSHAADAIDAPVRVEPAAYGAPHRFRRDGEVWSIGLDGTSAHLRDTKGMRDLAKLLAQPGTEVHVLDLIAEGPTLASAAPGDPIDDAARRQYRARLVDIEADLAEADQNADVARSERLHAERDALIAELSAAYGLGGRARPRGDSTERARSAVTQRIRDAITRIEAVDPGLGSHLRRSVRTGTFCSYEPERPISWAL